MRQACSNCDRFPWKIPQNYGFQFIVAANKQVKTPVIYKHACAPLFALYTGRILQIKETVRVYLPLLKWVDIEAPETENGISGVSVGGFAAAATNLNISC